MKGITISLKFLGIIGTVISCLLLMVSIHGCKHKTEGSVTKLKKISVFEVNEKLLQKFIRGQLSICSEQPEPEVRIYPAFESDRPFYGSIRFAGEYGQENSGILYHFAMDESQGTGKGYDRLYFDLNCDLDLTNDKPQVPLKHPPKRAALENSYIEQQVCFDYLNVNFDFGSNGERALEIMPRLMIYNGGNANMAFVTTRTYKGHIKIAGHKYDILLGHNYFVSGWFDRSRTALHLIPDGNYYQEPSWLGADRLMAIHKIDGTYYCFSATPDGYKLIVKPYEGGFGTFEIGPGERDISKMGIRGSLLSRDIAVAVGGDQEFGWPGETRISRVPVGDYLTDFMSISLGSLRISISNNYHSDGKPRDVDRPRLYAIKIREDEPYVLDFSNEPEVMFVSPSKNHRVKLGENLQIKAVLIDPELDIMIRRLYDTGTGPKQKNVSLDPSVIITRADGEKVAEGVMPFG